MKTVSSFPKWASGTLGYELYLESKVQPYSLTSVLTVYFGRFSYFYLCQVKSVIWDNSLSERNNSIAFGTSAGEIIVVVLDKVR